MGALDMHLLRLDYHGHNAMLLLDVVSGLIQRNLIFCLALTIVPIKLLMLRLSRDRDSERDALLATPEDLSYVTLGLILSSASGEGGNLQRLLQKSSHPHINILLLLAINVALTLAIHWIASYTRLRFMSWQAASALELARTADDDLHGHLPLVFANSETDANLRHVSMHHFAAFLFTLCVQCALLLPWLRWVGSLVRAG